MTADPNEDELNALDARIRQAEVKAGFKPPESEMSNRGDIKLTRIGSDFVATILASTGLGFLADWAFGTTPWGIVLMLLIGFAVGVRNVWRVLSVRDKTAPPEDNRD